DQDFLWTRQIIEGNLWLHIYVPRLKVWAKQQKDINMKDYEDQRFFKMAETYDKMAQLLVPKYDLLQDETLKIASFEGVTDPTVVDLGAGSGILLEKVLTRYPDAKCYWIDFSDDFLKIAKERLSRFGERIEFILSPIEEDWEREIENGEGKGVDAIFSMSAIHHLESAEKKRLYRRCFEILNRSGWFFNIDEMKTIYNDAQLKSLYFWIEHVEGARGGVPGDMNHHYQRWNDHFQNWKRRNVDEIDQPKKKGDDIHDSFLKQIGWLKEIGFANVDLYIKYHLWSVIGGQKF
ncbi:MAG: class I SAM-dependent methyltransferase, partial [Halobacteriota archaeon]|nr:class I SAM-dependent methyltransferase [Halobacteriota archaeon]